MNIWNSTSPKLNSWFLSPQTCSTHVLSYMVAGTSILRVAQTKILDSSSIPPFLASYKIYQQILSVLPSHPDYFIISQEFPLFLGKALGDQGYLFKNMIKIMAHLPSKMYNVPHFIQSKNYFLLKPTQPAGSGSLPPLCPLSFLHLISLHQPFRPLNLFSLSNLGLCSRCSVCQRYIYICTE